MEAWNSTSTAVLVLYTGKPLTNYKYAPKSYKTSLITEVYRAYNCTTSPKAVDDALIN